MLLAWRYVDVGDCQGLSVRKSCTWGSMRWQEPWCHHTIVLLAPPSQSHGRIPCAAAAGANEAVAVEARSDVLDRAGRWQSYSQLCR